MTNEIIDEEDIFESDFASTDEEANQDDLDAGEKSVHDEEKSARKVILRPTSIHAIVNHHISRQYERVWRSRQLQHMPDTRQLLTPRQLLLQWSSQNQRRVRLSRPMPAVKTYQDELGKRGKVNGDILC